MQIVFQDPYSSLNPRLRIGTNVGEPLRAAGVPKAQRRNDVVESSLRRCVKSTFLVSVRERGFVRLQ